MSETEENTKLGTFPSSSSSCSPRCLLRVVDRALLTRPAAVLQANAFHVLVWTLEPPLLMKETLSTVTPSTFIMTARTIGEQDMVRSFLVLVKGLQEV